MQSGDSIESSQILPEGEYPVYGGNGLRGFTENFNLDGHHVLIGRQGALCGNINYSFGKVWASEHAVVVYPLVGIDVDWLGETLRAMELNQYNVSAAQPGLSVSNITCLRLPYPPFKEQQKIANFLDHETAKIDTLIEKQQLLIKLLKEKRQAVISHAVTKGLNPDAPMKDSGVEWLGEVPEGWEVRKLKTLIKSGTSISYGIVQPGDRQDEGIPFIQTTNISKGEFEIQNLHKTTKEIASSYPRSKLSGGEVILGIRASIGAAYVVPEHLDGANLSRGIAKIVPSIDLSPEFLVDFLRSRVVFDYWGLASQGSTFSEVSIDTVRELSVVVPPPSEQEEISAYISHVSCNYEEIMGSAFRLNQIQKERRTALISAAVTGKIDVRNWQPPKTTSTPSTDA